MNASKNLSEVHHRMPVFLTDSQYPAKNTKALWLDPDVSFADCFKAIMKSKVYEGLVFQEVGTLVNSVKFDSPEIIMPKADYEEHLHQKGLGRFFTKISDLKQEETKNAESVKPLTKPLQKSEESK